MSNLSEPAFAPTEIDNQVSSLISEIANEQAAQVIAGEPSTPAAEPTATPAEPTAETPKPEDRGLERLVAREVELRERESKINAAQTEMEALRARLRELEPRAITQETIDRIKLSPQEGLRSIGIDPDELVRAALVEKLGDRANTPEIQDMLEKTRLRKEMDALRTKVVEAERRQAAQAYYNTVATGARDYTSNPDGLSKHAPTVATVAKSNPDRVFQEIMEEISRDAASRAAREPNGDVISYEEAARRVESRWSAMKSLLLAGVSPPGAPEVAPKASTPQPTTPVGAPQNTKTPPATIKPPERPLAPWLQSSKDEEEAIKEAMLEWQRAETARRK